MSVLSSDRPDGSQLPGIPGLHNSLTAFHRSKSAVGDAIWLTVVFVTHGIERTQSDGRHIASIRAGPKSCEKCHRPVIYVNPAAMIHIVTSLRFSLRLVLENEGS